MKNDIDRIKRYREFIAEIRQVNHYLIIGIDISKSSHHAFFGTASGKTIKRRLVFKNHLAGFCNLVEVSNALLLQNGLSKLAFGMEPTGNYHKPLGSWLIGQGYDVFLVSGIAVKRNRELLDGRWDKNDKKCAANIADLLIQGKCLYYDLPDPDIDSLRSLLSLRERMKKTSHILKMRIRNNLIAKHFPEYDSICTNCPQISFLVVKHCLSPKKIAAMEFGKFALTVTSSKYSRPQERHLLAAYSLARDSIGCEVTEHTQYEASILVDQFLQTKKLIGKIESRIDKIASRFEEYPYLLSIPGFGVYITALVIGKIGNPFRFQNKKQVLKMGGFDLSAFRSGKSSNNAYPVISKKGSSALRYGLFQAAVIASARNSYFIKYYTNQLKGRERDRGIKIKMRVKLAAKLLVTAWTIMKQKVPFDENLFGTVIQAKPNS